MGVDWLVERGDEFRGVLSMGLPGGIPFNKENIEKAKDFDLELTGADFVRQVLGDELMIEADNLALPGFTKTIVDPLNPDHGKEVPRWTIGDALGTSAEVLIDPFFAIGAAPRKALTPLVRGAAAGLRGASVPLRPITRPIGALLSQNGPIGGRLVPALSPAAAWKPIPEAIDLITLHGNEVAAGAHRVHDTVGAIAKRHKLGYIMGKPKAKGIDQDKLWRHIQTSPQELNAAERAVADDIKTALRRAADELKANGDEFFTHKNVAGRTVKFQYDPENFLRDMRPILHGVERLPTRTTLSKTPLSVRNQVSLPFRNLVHPGDEMFQWQKVGVRNRDPMHALQVFLESVNKRTVYHRRLPDANGVLRGVGLLEKYKLTDEGWHTLKQNKLLEPLNAQQFQNFRNKVHQITGHAVNREGIAHSALTENFMHNASKFINPNSKRYSRVIDIVTKPLRIGGVRRVYEDGTPLISRHTEISAFLVKNQMIAFLGFNPGSAIKNTSQALSLAAVKGFYPTLKGLYQMAAPVTEKAATLKRLRRHAGLNDSVQRLINDESIQLLNKYENSAMYMFNAFENTMRGTAFNVYAGETLEQMTKAGTKLANLSDAQLARAVNNGIIGANRVNFTYGVAGRSEWMARPVQRVATSLQSYNWKFAGFANDLLRNDPTAFTRLVALHGWAIEQAYLQAGINAESWLGWGFVSPNPIGRGPAVEMVNSLTKAFIARAGGDLSGASREIDKTTASMRALMELGERAGVPGWVPQAAYLSSAIGTTQFPVVAVSRFANAVSMMMTGEKRGADDELVRHVTPDDIIKSTMFQLHEDVVGRQLSELKRSNRNRYNFEVDRRVGRLMKAFSAQDGEAAIQEAKAAMWDPIPIKTERKASTIVGGALENLVASEVMIRPRPQDIIRKMKTRIIESKQPRAIREMMEQGWLESVLLGAYSQRALEAIEQLPEAQGQD
jgi:hypothetical protein